MIPATTASLLRRAGVPDPASGSVHHIRPADAGWEYVGFADHHLQGGQGFARPGDDREVAIVVLEGSADVRAGTSEFGSLGSRDRVFDVPPPPVLLVAPGVDLEVEAHTEASVIVADAPAAAVQRTHLFEPGDIRVETRGSGSTERRVHHLLPPSAQAGRLILFEVVTPGGNWSSYPPHKHDVEDPPREAYLEELYYYRFARPEGWAFARVYTADRSLDVSLVPRDRDVVLVPRGFHPVAAAPGYDAYYLNVMAGPQRAWHFSLDSEHAWLMDWHPTTAS